MNNFNEIKNLWHKQSVQDLPDVQEIIAQAKAFQRKTRISILLNNTLLALTIAFMLGVLVYYKPDYLTTKLGVLLAVIAMVMSIVLQNKMMQLLFPSKETNTDDNQHYLQKLIDFRNRQADFQDKVMSIYFLLLSVGIALYMIEYTMRMKWPYAVLCYAVTGAWIAFNWFYIRPKQIKKQRGKINAVIGNLEKVQSQLIEN